MSRWFFFWIPFDARARSIIISVERGNRIGEYERDGENICDRGQIILADFKKKINLFQVSPATTTTTAAVAAAASSSAEASSSSTNWVPVLRPEDLPKGFRREVRVNGRPVLLFWYRNQVRECFF